ncbi:hypothetical protein V6Z11_A12G147400 [Gossypium hirsutum]|uniref:Uncharacterized protein n=1 Tax=Gossypium hirsutum TaxID=3635 RepID=A0ABM2Z864_GOSHI|nr:uncharacterized protein LOC107940560 [Gossypium hirsutum]
MHSDSKGVVLGLETPFRLRFQRSERETMTSSQGTECALAYGDCAGIRRRAWLLKRWSIWRRRGARLRRKVGESPRVSETLIFWAFRACSCRWATSFCNWTVNWAVMI